MWFLYAIIHVFLMAVVNITDEKLAIDNKLPQKSDVHSKVGSVIIASTLMCFIGAIILGIITQEIWLDPISLSLALISAITMVAYWLSYFYLIQIYPVHLIVPLNQLSSIWLLIIELLFGGSITLIGFLGLVVLVYGAYVLDSGTLRWKIPTKLLLVSAPATFAWAITLFLVRKASETSSPMAIYFWQLIGTGSLGILLLIFVKRYKEAFLFRIKHQGKKFLGLSFLNEAFSETAYLFSTLAVAVAPVAAYVSAMSGAQGLFVILLVFILPVSERIKVTRMQLIAAILITIGVYLIKVYS